MAIASGDSNGKVDRLHLVATPWSLFDRPSIQIGVLKAYLQIHKPEIRIAGHHFFLKVAADLGFDTYRAISRRTWLAEPIYAALLYPQRYEAIKRLFMRQCRTCDPITKLDFDHIVAVTRAASQDFIGSVDWGKGAVAGFTVSHCQLTAALYLIQAIKQRFPETLTVIGGAGLSGDLGRDLLNVFAQVDIWVQGEGEKPLAALLRALSRDGDVGHMPAIDGVVTRYQSRGATQRVLNQVANLSDLPVPDFDDYFKAIRAVSPHQRFFPILPLEMSRGCWYQGAHGGALHSGCAFCNLNLQWNGYRHKKAPQLVREVETLTDRYQTLRLTFADNVLPKAAPALVAGLKTLRKDLNLFAEVRANLDFLRLKQLKQGGIEQVQVGIEALSSDLLKQLNKGTTVIQNIAMMRNCQALGIQCDGNLIVGFPGSTAVAVNQTLEALPFLLPFRPLQVVHFWLGYGSPVWRQPQKFNIRGISNHYHYRSLFPKSIGRALRFNMLSYRGDVTKQGQLWRPVIDRVRQWTEEYNHLRRMQPQKPLLGYSDGRRFLIIRQYCLDGAHQNHRLKEPSRSLYLYCEQPRSLKQICRRFDHIRADQIEAFLNMMVAKKLVFEEKKSYLSLAVPNKCGFF